MFFFQIVNFQRVAFNVGKKEHTSEIERERREKQQSIAMRGSEKDHNIQRCEVTMNTLQIAPFFRVARIKKIKKLDKY